MKPKAKKPAGPTWYLKEWREKFGRTQEELAEAMGTNKGQVSKLERGAQRMNDRWIKGYSNALGIRSDMLLTLPPESGTSPIFKSSGAHDHLCLLLPDILNAPPETQARVAGFIEALLAESKKVT